MAHTLSALACAALLILASASTPEARLALAASTGSLQGVREAIKDGARLDDQDPGSGQTPLMASCLGGHAPLVRALLKAGADGFIGERENYTCLDGAGFQGRADVAALVLEHYSDRFPTTPHKDGYHPIHRACWGREDRHAQTVRAFLNAGVPYDIPTAAGETPLQLARKSGNAATVAFLEDAAAKGKADEEL